MTDWVTPRKWLPSRTYAEQYKAKWHAVYPQGPCTRAPAVCLGSLSADLQRRLDPVFPEAGVLELQNAVVYGEPGWIITKEGYLLPDHSWYGRHVNEMSVPAWLPVANWPEAKWLEGVCLSLASDFAVGSYGHFLLDSISRLELFSKAGFDLSNIDHLICPKPPSANAERLFRQLGIPASKCVWADGNVAVRAETLLAPTFPGTRRNYPEWVPDFLKRTFFWSSTTPPTRRLYISRRGGRRNSLNEASVERILLQNDFEIYHPSGRADTPRDFAEAAIVVGSHGGGLTDLAFCQKGTKVLELIPTDHVYPYYYTLSDATGLEYRCMVCRSAEERGPDAFGPSVHDFHVDEREFFDAIRLITSASVLR